MNYRIGDFSMITRINVKTLRYYHDEGILVPAGIDRFTGYRLYDGGNVERGRIILELRTLNFSIKEIKDILSHCSNDSDLVSYLMQKQDEVKEKIRSFQEIEHRLNAIIQNEKEIQTMDMTQDIQIKHIPGIICASIRYSGTYGEVGRYFGELFRKVGGLVNGAPFCLYHDTEYRETDADIEACIPIKRTIIKEGLSVRTLPAITATTILHKGPYENLGNSYRYIFDFMNELKSEALTPSREVYLKGPGMIFTGNPKKYLTEIQIPFREGS